MPSQLWSVDTYCVDDTCLTPAERVPVLADPDQELPYSSAIDVSVSSSKRRYRIVVTSPDGVTFSYDGDVTTGRVHGDECRPNIHSATLSVDHDGDLTVQRP